jgi:CHAD domain-containing protein
MEAVTAGELVARYLQRQVDDLLIGLAGMRAGRGSALHRTRMAARRPRSTFAVFRATFDDTVSGTTTELRQFARTSGVARDAEVQSLRLTSSTSLTLATPADALLREYLCRARKKGAVAARAALHGDTHRHLLVLLDNLLAEPPFTECAWQPAEGALRQPLQHVFTAVRHNRSTETVPRTRPTQKLPMVAEPRRENPRINATARAMPADALRKFCSARVPIWDR